MSEEGIAALQHASMGLLCDPRKQEEILNDLKVEWVKLALELELGNIVRRRFPGHSEGAYGRLERWIDELGFIGSDVRFLAQRLWSVIVSWFAPLREQLSKPSVPRPSARRSLMRRKPSRSGMPGRQAGGRFGSTRRLALPSRRVSPGSTSPARLAANGARRPAHARPASGRVDLEPHPFGVVPPVLAQRAVREARNADGRAAVKLGGCLEPK